jgi:hypothetical protein
VRGKSDDDLLLVKLDVVMILTFVLGVVLTGAIAMSSGLARIP